jgi:aerobic-type carbon monoxide dehydrogenase small subunit (CoxS/CutS family)
VRLPPPPPPVCFPPGVLRSHHPPPHSTTISAITALDLPCLCNNSRIGPCLLTVFSQSEDYIPPPVRSRVTRFHVHGGKGSLFDSTFRLRTSPTPKLAGEIMPTVKELHVNGAKRPVTADAERSLLSVLRDDLDLTGSKYGCGEGRCGACTVLIDGQPTRSCTTRVGTAEGKPIRTIEGLAQGDKLHPVQEAFLNADAMQCGYCTSGMILSAVGLLTREKDPTREDIVRAMSGNICRCCTYQRIITAVEQAAKVMKGGDR